ncbi:MAG TPA: sigma 54-interacting transcriptional regulator [Candidatus Sulfotelmatobacter sp.]|nr:sigma 54-interacting transcriptional regulator [Candidatus Sulfotelmatobacter sp.]
MSTSNRSSDSHDSVASARRSVAEPDAGVQPEIAVFSTDLQGGFRGCNAAFSGLLGYSPEELRGRDLATIFARTEKLNGDRSLSRTILADAGEQGDFHSRLFAHPKAGCSIPVQFSATLLRDSSASPTAVIAMITPLANASPSANVLGEAPSIVSRKIDDTVFILASPIMHKFMGLVDRVAGHTETVLITGETGTGKELIARTVHESSQRRGRPWVDINCAALPENLVESELFGYEKGAFSGADASKPGLFELADKGTLFLDEIGELQLQTQVKLLRVLDGQPFYRLGGHRKIHVDVRIVAATNQDLEAAVKNGRFRQDLFHRLGQFQLRVPPLRERPEDIVALAEHFLHLKASRKNFSSRAISALLSHSWPGNIRELRNLVARMAMESAGSEIDFSSLSAALTGEPAALRQTASLPVSNLDSMEEQMIIKALERTGGQRTLAAEQLGISRRTLSRKLKEYNINFAPGETTASLGFISNEQQKFFRARVETTVTIRNSRGEEARVHGVNLSTGGMGLDGIKEPLRFAGLLDVSFMLPESEILFQAKARLMWIGEEGRVGIRFVVIEPALFEQLQHWTNRKMKEEGWEFPT